MQDCHPRFVFSQRTKEHSWWKSLLGSFSNDSLSCHDAFRFVSVRFLFHDHYDFFANAFTRLQHVSLEVHT